LYTTGPIQSSLSGIIDGDDVTIGTFNSKFKLNSVGSNAIDISNLIIVGQQSNNYLVLGIPSFYSYITQRNLNISFYGGSKVYDGYRDANSNIYGIINNIVSGEIITISSFIAMFQDQNIGLRFIDISSVILSGPTLFNYNLLPVVSISGIIIQRGLNATFTGGNKIYDATRYTGPVFGSLSGIMGIENVTISTYISFFKSGLVGYQSIDISYITLQGSTAYNYFIYPIGPFKSYINYRTLIASFTGGTKIYDSLSFS
jgi:hypothetical protein